MERSAISTTQADRMAASQEMDINMIYLNHHAITITASAVRSTVTAFWFQTHFQRHTMPARVLLIYHLHPDFCVLFAFWLLRKTFAAHVIFGGGVDIVRDELSGHI